MRINRDRYAELFGPTTGDRIRLGDTSLIVEVERDTTKSWRMCFGGGKTPDGLVQHLVLLPLGGSGPRASQMWC